jgi:hypothetical protein
MISITFNRLYYVILKWFIKIVGYKWSLKNVRRLNNYKTNMLYIQLFIGLFLCYSVLLIFMKQNPSLNVDSNKPNMNNLGSIKNVTTSMSTLFPAVKSIGKREIDQNISPSDTTTNFTTTTTTTTTTREELQETTTKTHKLKPDIVGN